VGTEGGMDCGHARYKLDGGTMRDGDMLRAAVWPVRRCTCKWSDNWSGMYRHLARLD
jgi:hypothetical protein